MELELDDAGNDSWGGGSGGGGAAASKAVADETYTSILACVERSQDLPRPNHCISKLLQQCVPSTH
jgi:hypothetical protein